MPLESDPPRTDGPRTLLLGPGPAVIGEGGELDGAAALAVQALRARGHQVILVTSNPATTCSRASLAHRTYLEPLDVDAIRAILAAERPTHLSCLFGGPPALALTLTLCELGALEGIELSGISPEALQRVVAQDAVAARRSLAGEAGWTGAELVLAVGASVAAEDPQSSLTLAAVESLDRADVHPGDSIAITPPLTLREGALAALEREARRAIVATGLGAGIISVELAYRAADGVARALHVNPAVSRVLAMAALAGGRQRPLVHRMVELGLGDSALPPSSIIPPSSSLPPSMRSVDLAGAGSRGFDVRWPRFAFETFPDADAALGPARKSVGESIGWGPTAADALRSGARGGDDGLPIPRPFRPAPRLGSEPARTVIVLGAGPTRIGSGSEVGACAAEALATIAALGYDAVFVDSSPESATVATSVGARVLLEPVTLDRVLAICREERPLGVVTQVGGETALALAGELAARGIPVLGTPQAAFARASSQVQSDRRTTPPPSDWLDRAIGLEVVALADGERVVIAGVVEHLEPPYIHAGDAAAILPCVTPRADVVERVEARVRELALSAGVVGLLAVHVAVRDDAFVVLDIEPRATRLVPFVSRATGLPIVELATQVLLGRSLAELGVREQSIPRHVAAMERVFPFERLGVDTSLGPEMRSTGAAIGLGDTPARAYAKALRGIGVRLHAPRDTPAAIRPAVLLDVAPDDRSTVVGLGRRFRAIGFELFAIGGTREALKAARIAFHDLGADDPTAAIAAVTGDRVALAIVTSDGGPDLARSRALRASLRASHVTCFSTIALARLGCAALEEDSDAVGVRALADYHAARD